MRKSVYESVVREVANWIRAKVHESEKAEMLKPWIYRGGKWNSNSGLKVEVKIDGYDKENGIPAYWVLRLEHADSEYAFRRWRTDIALQSRDQQEGILSVTLKWYLRGDYFGEEPEIPALSVPKVVRSLFNSSNLNGLIDNIPLRSKAILVNPGEGRTLYKYITSPERTIPIILLNIEEADVGFFDVDKLQRALLGSTVVYWFYDASVFDELGFEWGSSKRDNYNCKKNTIRVYQPRLDFTKGDYDWKRHRFFHLKGTSNSEDDLLRVICQSTFRIAYRGIAQGKIYDFESLDLERQRVRLNRLKESVSLDTSTLQEKEYIQALEEENQRLTCINSDLASELNDEKDKAVEYELLSEDVKMELEKTKQQFSMVSDAVKKVADFEQTLAAFRSYLTEFPKTLYDLVLWFKDIFQDRVVILDEALHAANGSNFNNLSEIWTLFRAVGDNLFTLHFRSTNSSDIESEFKNQTGIELSLKEGKMTKADPRLRALRTRIYGGKKISINAHVKLDKGGKNFRLYYYPDNIKELIVIGHIGGHLDTAGTARRKDG